MNLIDPIPALTTPQIHSYLRGPRAREWQEWCGIIHLVPFVIAREWNDRGDPVNKKALRAFARRHIALDCHSRTTTFSTLIVLLRNDSGGVTRDRPPFVKASGGKPPRPNHPRKLHFRGARYRATPPLDEDLCYVPVVVGDVSGDWNICDMHYKYFWY